MSILVVLEVYFQEFADICESFYWGDDCYSVIDKFKSFSKK